VHHAAVGLPLRVAFVAAVREQPLARVDACGFKFESFLCLFGILFGCVTVLEVEDAVVADEAEHHAEREQFGVFRVDLLHQVGGRPVLAMRHEILALQVHGKPENQRRSDMQSISYRSARLARRCLSRLISRRSQAQRFRITTAFRGEKFAGSTAPRCEL
jgi:hypothetical protein